MPTRKKGYKIILMVFVLLACTMLVAFKSQETLDLKHSFILKMVNRCK